MAASRPRGEAPFLYPLTTHGALHLGFVLRHERDGVVVRVPGYFGTYKNVLVSYHRLEPADGKVEMLRAYRPGTRVYVAAHTRARYQVERVPFAIQGASELRRPSDVQTVLDFTLNGRDFGAGSPDDADGLIRVLRCITNHVGKQVWADRFVTLPYFRRFLQGTEPERHRDPFRTTVGVVRALGDWIVDRCVVWLRIDSVERPVERTPGGFEELRDRCHAPYSWAALDDPPRRERADALLAAFDDYLAFLPAWREGREVGVKEANLLVRPLFTSYAAGFL